MRPWEQNQEKIKCDALGYPGFTCPMKSSTTAQLSENRNRYIENNRALPNESRVWGDRGGREAKGGR